MIFDKYKNFIRRMLRFLLVISILLWIVLFFAYLIQPDFCAAVTFWPVWIWAIPGIVLSLSSIGIHKKVSLAVALIWVLFVCLTAEEPLAIMRNCVSYGSDCKTICKSGICLSVISLNCAGGNINAAEELSQFAPDIVLLQESPPINDLKILVKKLFADEGEFIYEADTAILARGRVTKTEVKDEYRGIMTGARVLFPSGLQVEILSVHLPPPAVGTNLLSSDCWREHREDRQHRLEKIFAIVEHIRPVDHNIPVVIGGDFNAKPWRGAVKILNPRLFDTFTKGGFGWPGTGPSHFPLWRVDQIWASSHFKTIKVRSENCKNSDHRIVICDLCKL